MGSRRACEELIEQARVEVNGEIVIEQGMRVDPEKDEIKVDGLTVATQSYLFFALNKPAGVVSTMEDPEGRQCLGDYVTNRETRLFHVGRLDTETEGIILLTNHGELAHRLTHPRYGVRRSTSPRSRARSRATWASSSRTASSWRTGTRRRTTSGSSRRPARTTSSR